MSAESTPPPSRSRGVPIWTLLILLLVVAAVGLVALGTIIYVTRSDNVRLAQQLKDQESQRARDKIEAEKAAAVERLALARNRQEEVLTLARNATNVLGQLLQDLNAVTGAAATLKTNDEGRRVALDADLLDQARRFYETDLRTLPPATEIDNKLLAARRIEQTIVANLGKLYLPEAAAATTVQTAGLWADPEQRKVTQAQTLVASLMSEARLKVPTNPLPTDAPTLAEAIRLVGQKEAAQRQGVFTAAAKKADVDATTTKAKADTDAVLTQANAEAKAKREQAQVEADRIITESRIAASNLMADLDRKMKEFERKQAFALATNQIAEAKTKVDVEKAAIEAAKVILRQKASDSAVQVKLAPFIQKGLWQIKGYSTEAKPLSFNALNSSRALEDSQGGMNAMYHIVTCVDDKMRPRWKLAGGVLAWRKFPESVERIKAAQNLLIELGAVLVELGKLQP